MHGSNYRKGAFTPIPGHRLRENVTPPDARCFVRDVLSSDDLRTAGRDLGNVAAPLRNEDQSERRTFGEISLPNSSPRDQTFQ